MAEAIELIPLAEWERKPICDLFAPTSPFYAMTFRTDVTHLYERAKRDGLSVYSLCVYVTMQAVNSVPAFLCKLRNGDTVARLPYLSPSFTAPTEEGLFKIVNVEWRPGERAESFCARMQENTAAQTELLPSAEDEARDDFAYLSCVPWLDFMTLTHETPKDCDESAPRLAWGKIVESEGKRSMSYSVQVNHKLLDGRHIAAFADALQLACDAL